ncbi:cytochrome c oxidase subunit 3 [Cyclobacterium plantarum]|uniref:Cytochrome C oxidase subunit III n=1 Tax=Cyclobacterium plantarum TaxID=2716263 RepID=A0ABX0H9I8_9BACT|nr:cytochrome C oxidase subunit III [Cyclobacterium plantarum]NHE57077.1 cytochrome C oxidase subunit III [Cyclobacterium plantarum]
MQREEKSHWFEKIENLHPYRTIMYLGMFGSGLIFLFLMTAFVLSQPEAGRYDQFAIPKSFIISSMVIIVSSFTSGRILPYFNSNNIEKTKIYLFVTLLLGLLFSTLQFTGWRELSGMGIDFRGLPSGSFLYLLSGIHLFHLAGALIYALVLLIHLKKSEKDPVSTLILLSNPYEEMKLGLFSVYWKFMDAVWLVLFILFLWMF